MSSEELTFEIVDDRVAAHVRGKLLQAGDGIRFASSAIAPLVELAYPLRRRVLACFDP
jgi:hypothetical protein